jgi:sugar phosphate isomerase/epimerase
VELGHHCNQLRHLEELVAANGLQRAELYNYAPEQRDELRSALRRLGIRGGVHAPLYRKEWYPWVPTWMFLHDIDPEPRELSRRLARESILESGDLGAEYIVLHFPGPRSATTASASLDHQRAVALESAGLLAEWGKEAGVTVCLEAFGPSPLLSADFLVEVFDQFPSLGYCWDTGHLHYSAQRDGFDYYALAEQLRPHVRSIQMWGTRHFDDYRHYHHIPVHPSQRPDDGWVDIDRTLRLLLNGGRSMPVIFESPPRYPTELGAHDYREGIRWVQTILADISS